MEELVGAILSEREAPESMVTKEEGGSVLVIGTAQIRELNRELALALEEGEDYSTLGGLCTWLAGGIPAKGTVLWTRNGIRLEVVDSSPTRVHRVRVTPPESLQR
jgi:putative hemolysin